MNKLYKNKNWLKQQVEENKSVKELAEICNVSKSVISYWKKKYNIISKLTARKHSLNFDYFHDIDTPEKAYWLGFLMADGYIEKIAGIPSRLVVSLKTVDILHLEKLKNSLSSDVDIVTKKVEDKRGSSWKICRIRISSRELCRDLAKYGIVSKKTAKELIPNILDKFKWSFLCGFFDGDGCISVKRERKIGFCSSSLYIINQIHSFLKKYNLDFNHQIRTGYSMPFYVMESRMEERNRKLLAYMYNSTAMHLDRKYNLFLENFSAPIKDI